MLNRFAAISCLTLLCGSALGALAGEAEFKKKPLQATHPLVGIWRVELPELKCFEQLEVRADGTRSGTSGEEVLQAETIISTLPDADGFYRWADKVVEGNGKPDCWGSSTAVGHISVVFVKLSSDRNSFYQCQGKDGKVCMGPYVKQHGV